MASTLELENLGRIVQIGPGSAGGPEAPDVSERQVLQEMRKQGMDVPTAGGPAPVGETATTFSDMLKKSVEQVNEDQVQADHAIKELVAGRTKNIHETLLAIERADDSLRLMMQVRNKVLDAYKEIMHMQV